MKSSRDDPTLGIDSPNSLFTTKSRVCFIWCPYSISSGRKKGDALSTQMASVNTASKKHSSGSGECERLVRPKRMLKLSSVSLGLSELPGRAGSSVTEAEDGATSASLETKLLLPLVHLQLSKIACVLRQKGKALPTFYRDNTLFHSAGYLGSKENIIAYQLPCEYNVLLNSMRGQIPPYRAFLPWQDPALLRKKSKYNNPGSKNNKNWKPPPPPTCKNSL